MNERQVEAVEMLPFWPSLKNNQKEMVKTSFIFDKLGEGKVIKGGEGDIEGLILVVQGQLRAYMNAKQGKEITLYRLLDRDMCVFSSTCMIKNNQTDIFLEAEKDTDILLIPSVAYRRLLNSSLGVSDFTNRLISERFSQVMSIMEQALFSSFEKRLAHFLLEQSNIEASETLTITHEGLARHLGTAREVVTRKLKEFAREGYIKMGRGNIEIIDVRKLRNIV